MTYARDLLNSARKLLNDAVGAPLTSSDCNRAVSTAYYAIFDCFCRVCADQVAGPTDSMAAPSDAWVRIYRSLDHKQVSDALHNVSGLDNASQDYVVLMRAITKSCLEARGEADYNRDKNYEAPEALELIGEAGLVLNIVEHPTTHGFDLEAFSKSLTVELFSRKRR